jgi:hypothetical protein
MDKDYLTLKRASASRPSGEWSDDDYDVLADGFVVGRIFKVNAAPVGHPWMWTLAFEQPRAYTRICSNSRGRDGGIREELAAGVKGHKRPDRRANDGPGLTKSRYARPSAAQAEGALVR